MRFRFKEAYHVTKRRGQPQLDRDGTKVAYLKRADQPHFTEPHRYTAGHAAWVLDLVKRSDDVGVPRVRHVRAALRQHDLPWK